MPHFSSDRAADDIAQADRENAQESAAKAVGAAALGASGVIETSEAMSRASSHVRDAYSSQRAAKEAEQEAKNIRAWWQ